MATQFPNLGGFTEDQRKAFYSSPNFTPQNVNAGLQSTGLSAGTVLNDYNQLMGSNLSPIQGASWLTGMNEGQMGQWLGQNAGNPSAISQQASYYGMGNQDLSSLVNNYYGTNVTPDQVQSYMAGQQGTTWTPKGVPYSQSSGGGNSFSGMDWSKSPVSFDYLQQQAAGLPQAAQNVGDATYQKYAQMMQEALGNKSNFAGVMGDLGARNMLGGTVQSDALAKSANSMAQNIGQQAYESQLQAELAKMNIPQVLAQIAGLGHITQQSSSNSSYQSDPGAPERIIESLIQSGW